MSLLAFLHGGVCETWRVCVFSKALQSQEEVVRVAAVKAFPLLLHHLGNMHYDLIGTTLLYGNSCINKDLTTNIFSLSFIDIISHFVIFDGVCLIIVVPSWRTVRSR